MLKDNLTSQANVIARSLKEEQGWEHDNAHDMHSVAPQPSSKFVYLICFFKCHDILAVNKLYIHPTLILQVCGSEV